MKARFCYREIYSRWIDIEGKDKEDCWEKAEAKAQEMLSGKDGLDYDGEDFEDQELEWVEDLEE